MKQLNQRGHINGLLIPLVLAVLLFFGALGFGFWAFAGMQDYKTNTDAKVATAVTVAETKQAARKDAQFVEKEKLPLRTYSGPAAYGSLVVKYPKTWSAYIAERNSASAPVDAFFHPNFVPAADSNGQSFALRVQIVGTDYASVLRGFDGGVKTGKVKSSAYIPTKQPKVTGVRLDGEISNGKQGSMVILPIRDKTLKLWTESADFLGDFNNNILPNFTFSQ